jgi:dolichol-phosphate mannosyltransferase
MFAQDGVSVVVPVYNESGNIRPLFQAVARQFEALGTPFEILFVDDGSRDDSLDILHALTQEDPRVRIVALSRNFGHQSAVTAGMDHARGCAVVVMDADLQHPPELIPQMIAAWRAGAQVVFTIREDDKDLGLFKRSTSSLFYKIINAISDVPIVEGAADFRLMDRTVVEALRAMPERSRFLRGMVSWLGFRQVGLPYRPHARLSGTSKYSLRKMVSLAMNGITSFSCVPLRWAMYAGLFSALSGIPYALWTIYARLFTDVAVPGWASMMIAILFLGGVQLMSLGVIGEYLGRVYTEVKGRPLYLTSELVGFDAQDPRGGPMSDHRSFHIHTPHMLPFPSSRGEASDYQCR